MRRSLHTIHKALQHALEIAEHHADSDNQATADKYEQVVSGLETALEGLEEALEALS